MAMSRVSLALDRTVEASLVPELVAFLAVGTESGSLGATRHNEIVKLFLVNKRRRTAYSRTRAPGMS